MSQNQPSSPVQRQGLVLATATAMLVLCVGVALSVLDGTARTTAAVALGLALVVCAGFAGATWARTRR